MAAADDDLFFQVMYNDKHVLNFLLPAKTERAYTNWETGGTIDRLLLGSITEMTS